MSAKSLLSAATVLSVLILGSHVFAKDEIRKERVLFKEGAVTAVIKGRVKGYETVDYLLGASAGQTMQVALQTSNGANYFNVLAPGSDAAIAIGSNLGNQWTGTLPADGDYTVRVYLMRSAARRDQAANFTLTVGITGRADARVARTPYHATGTVPCSVGTDPQGSAQCSFGVIRSALGHADVYLASPGYDVALHRDKLRVLNFAGSVVTSTDPNEKVASEKRGDNWSVGVNDFYYYIIPEAVVSGG